jgi:hypothetical protein
MANNMIKAGAVATVKAGRRLTRNHFKRKLITAGIAVFASLAISTTGFAAWVLSTSGHAEHTGNVTVGVVEDASITISDLTFENEIQDLSFDCRADDNVASSTNRVVASEGAFESLKVKFTCTIENATNANEIVIQFHQPKGITDAIEAGYLTLPTNLSSGTTGTLDRETNSTVYTVKIKENGQLITAGNLPTGVSYISDGKDIDLTYTIEYGWGEAFGGMNPGDYYDEDETGKAVISADVLTALHTFKAMCHDMDLDDYLDWYNDEIADPDGNEDLEGLQFKVLIDATT